MSYRIVTIANKNPEFEQPYYTFTAFFKSLQGEQPLVLGTQPGEYGGLGSKPRLLYKAIKENLITEKHIIFCDCFDLVFAIKPEQLFLKYFQFASPLVISAEKNCFPGDTREEFDKLDNYGSPYKYLNSGMIVGETEAMLAVLESMDAKNIPNDYWSEEHKCMINPNDQLYYQQEFLKQPVKIVLDTPQRLCNTLHDVKIDELDFNGDAIFNKETKTFPASFHLNGGAKTGGLREPILDFLKL